MVLPKAYKRTATAECAGRKGFQVGLKECLRACLWQGERGVREGEPTAFLGIAEDLAAADCHALGSERLA